MIMSKPIRILQIVMDVNRGGGVLNVVLNWHRNIDRDKVQFDYLTCFSPDTEQSAKEEIETLGGRVFYIPYQGLMRGLPFVKAVFSFFKHNRYDIIHSHVTQLNFIYYPIAKFFGVKTIIQHAHVTQWSDKKINGWRNCLMLHTVWPLIDLKLACSNLVGSCWYKDKYRVVANAVNLQRFAFKPDIRANIRKELGVEDNFVIGNVGRLEWQKNHEFIVDIFAEILKTEPKAKLILLGEGSLKEKIRKKISLCQLDSFVIWLNLRPDIENVFQALDCLLMPSFYEGLPVAGVEAQCSGVPAVFADTITKEVKILEASSFLSLRKKAKDWAAEILRLRNYKRTDGVSMAKTAGFDIKDITRDMQNLYLELTNE